MMKMSIGKSGRAFVMVVGIATVCMGMGDETQTPAANALAKFKALAGEWVSADDPKAGVQVVYRVISAGTTVMETLFPGTDHEMVSMYHLDGADLIMTHYCSAGNQPKLKFVAGSDPNIIKFDFAGGSNIKKGDVHINGAIFNLSDSTHLKSEWTSMKDDKPQDSMKFDFVRKAP